MADKSYKTPTSETRHRHVTSSQQRLMSRMKWDATVARQRADRDDLAEQRARDFDWLEPDETVHAQVCKELDMDEMIARLELAGDGIIYESSHGEYCKCWECKV